ncbi:MAG: EF-hand domain-containing protein [Gammaproteobacteria bacterium]|nr:EF-hand domain-containing protein [Gammaproteobacteria bacterium]
MISKKNSLIPAAIGLVSFLTFAAHAQQSAQTGYADGPAFAELDQNEDGVITEAEARGTSLEAAFSAVDANGDGYITKTEYEEATR